jgi:hypothetical protein
MKRIWWCVFLTGMCGSTASAEMLTVSSTPASTGEIDVVMNDCSIHTNGEAWLSSLFICELTAGELYQPGEGSLDPEVLWTYDPEHPVDSWIAPGASYYEQEGWLAVEGPWYHLSYFDVGILFISDLVDGIVPPWDGLAARFTFTDDAQGIWALQVSARGSNPRVYVGRLENGFMIIPEPGWLVLLAGLLGLGHRPVARFAYKA